MSAVAAATVCTIDGSETTIRRPLYGLPRTEFPCSVRLEIFEGPLDLLLYLVRRNELDISRISIVQVADQFIEYLALMELLDVEVAGEFLVIAATLMVIKSGQLLPVDETEETFEDSEDEADLQQELIERLEEYRRVKEQAQRLGERIEGQCLVFPRPSSNGNGNGNGHGELFEAVALQSVSVFDLLSVFKQMLLRAREAEETGTIERQVLTVPQKMEEILTALARRNGSDAGLSFFDTIAAQPTRAEVIVAFLAILELIRRRRIVVEQRAVLGEIRMYEVKSKK